MSVITVHGLQLQFDSNGQPPEVQAKQVFDAINGILAQNEGRLGGAQLISHRDEIEEVAS